MRTVLMGSPDFAVPSLLALDQNFELVGVISQPDKPAGRGRNLRMPAVKRAAIKLSIPIIQPQSLKDPTTLNGLQDWQPDVIIVAAYGKILPDDILSFAPHGSLNVHASLLPRWRGAAPIQAAILHGDKETGVTIMKMDAGLDTGPIITQEKSPIHPDETGGELFDRLATMGAELLTKTLPPYVAGELTPIPQEDSLATYAPLLKKSDGKLDFRQSADLLARQVRAYNPWPGSFFHWDNRRHLVHRAEAIESSSEHVAGDSMVWESYPAVACATGILVLRELQPAGKQRMDGADFINGAKEFPGAKLLDQRAGKTAE